eukprot:TRINITY_DN1304_c0_g1_i4.p2 TRINITY_DN1304_c0_g1~~TRINITY_DN1304_c0_g1_i4.p2  ORF type:complete len:104 (+),score=17.02 TRINITY_DN1304_c0_g1_i4:273-584(+)
MKWIKKKKKKLLKILLLFSFPLLRERAPTLRGTAKRPRIEKKKKKERNQINTNNYYLLLSLSLSLSLLSLSLLRSVAETSFLLFSLLFTSKLTYIKHRGYLSS